MSIESDINFTKPAWKVDRKTAVRYAWHKKLKLKGPSTQCEVGKGPFGALSSSLLNFAMLTTAQTSVPTVRLPIKAVTYEKERGPRGKTCIPTYFNATYLLLQAVLRSIRHPHI